LHDLTDMNAMKKSYTNDMNQIQCQHEDAMDALRVEHASHMDSIEQTHQQERQTLETLKEQIEVEQTKHMKSKTLLQLTVQEAVIAESKIHETNSLVVEKKHQSEMDRLVLEMSQKEDRMAEEQSTFQSKLKDMTLKYNAQCETMKTNQRKGVEQLQELETEWSKSMRREEEITMELEQYQVEIERLTGLADKEKENSALLENTCQNHVMLCQELKERIQTLEVQQQTVLGNKLKALQKQVQAKDVLLEEHVHEQHLQKKTYDEEIEELKLQHAQETNVIKEQHERALSKQHGSNMDATSMLVKELKRKHMDEMNAMIEQHESAMEASAAMLLESLKQSHTEEMGTLLEQHGTAMAAMKEKMQQIVGQVQTNETKTSNVLTTLELKHSKELQVMETQRMKDIDASKLILEETILPYQLKLDKAMASNAKYSTAMLDFKILLGE
jgi:hypothetical protein